MSDIQELKNFIKHLAIESGSIIKQYFRTDVQVDTKSDQSPVTIADQKTEEKIRSLIQKHYPDHGMIGEEFGNENLNADYQWVIDPIDGTKSFIAGAFDFGTIIGLLYQGQPILGMIHQPILQEILIGDNQQTTYNDKVVRCRQLAQLSDAILLTTDFFKGEGHQDLTGFNQLTKQVKLARTWGNTFGYSLVACGYADIMIDPVAASWDFMGAIPIIRGAGGIISDYQGDDPVTGNSIVACNPCLHQQVLKALK